MMCLPGCEGMVYLFQKIENVSVIIWVHFTYVLDKSSFNSDMFRLCLEYKSRNVLDMSRIKNVKINIWRFSLASFCEDKLDHTKYITKGKDSH